MDKIEQELFATIEQQSAYEMAIINPKLSKLLTIQTEIEQRNEGPVPHLHVYHDKTRNPKKCSFIRLDKPEYAPHHPICYLTKKEKEEFIRLMTSEWNLPRQQGSVRGYDRAVDVWIDTFEPDEEAGLRKFQLDENGNYIMPDYTQLQTRG